MTTKQMFGKALLNFQIWGKKGKMLTEKPIPTYRFPEYPETYGELHEWAFKRVADPRKKICFRMSDPDIAITYSEFVKNVNKICNLFKQLGIKRKDHIAILLNNCPEYAYLYHSISKIGAIVAPINPFLRGESLRYILQHSDSKYLITSKELFLEKLNDISLLVKNLKSILFIDEMVAVKGTNTVLFSEFQKLSSDYSPEFRISGDDVQGIWYTSGTTGVPKGAIIKNKSYTYRVLFMADYFRLTPADVSYYTLPMYHAAYVLLGGPLMMAAGSEIVQVRWFSASNFWKEVVRYKTTLTFSTGTIIPILLKQAITEEERKGREVLGVWFGWPVDDPKSVKERWPKIKFLSGYGTTEAPYAALSDYDNPEFGNAGFPSPMVKGLKIIDPISREEVGPNKVGEIVYGHILGPDYIVKEYYKDPGRSKEMIKDGLWYSGDLGYLDDRRCLHFVDRLKDYLRIGGENVSSAVVEEIIRKQPNIMEVAIVGVKGELGHDELVAHVVAKEGTVINEREFFERCNEDMAYFMVPRYLVVRNEIPKTGTSRIEKYKLRDEGIPPMGVDRSRLGIVLKR